VFVQRRGSRLRWLDRDPDVAGVRSGNRQGAGVRRLGGTVGVGFVALSCTARRRSDEATKRAVWRATASCRTNRNLRPNGRIRICRPSAPASATPETLPAHFGGEQPPGASAGRPLDAIERPHSSGLASRVGPAGDDQPAEPAGAIRRPSSSCPGTTGSSATPASVYSPPGPSSALSTKR